MVLQTKNGSETPQVLLNHKFKSKMPLNMARAHAGPFQIVLPVQRTLQCCSVLFYRIFHIL